MSLHISSKTLPAGFKSSALKNALQNFGRLPTLLAKLGIAITKEVKSNLSGKLLQRRSGALCDSWEWEVAAASLGWRLIIGSDVVYARIHNFGGWAGAGHRTKIKKTSYLDKAVLTKKEQVRAIIRNYMARITRG